MGSGILENLRLGALDGIAALIVILVVVISAVAIIAVAIVNCIKAAKEHKDALEDKAEDEFFAEYGVTGEEMRLNRQLSEKRAKLLSNKRIREELLDEEHLIIVHDTVEVPVEAESSPVNEQPSQPVSEEPVRQEPPVEERNEKTVEEPAPAVVAEETAPEPVKEEKAEEPKPVKPEKSALKKKPDDWSKYDGEYEGVYYDPEDACYYEGTPSPALAKKLAAKKAELDAEAKKNRKEVIVKKITPPFLALKTPKNKRNEPAKVDGFDESIIYGKYIVEHVSKEDGSEEYFYTLYSPSNKILYQSSNYSALEYVQRAITRFQTHVLVGSFLVEVEDSKFFFELRRKSYVHKGDPQNSFEEANALISEVKKYAQTDIIREQ